MHCPKTNAPILVNKQKLLLFFGWENKQEGLDLGWNTVPEEQNQSDVVKLFSTTQLRGIL